MCEHFGHGGGGMRRRWVLSLPVSCTTVSSTLASQENLDMSSIGGVCFPTPLESPELRASLQMCTGGGKQMQWKPQGGPVPAVLMKFKGPRCVGMGALFLFLSENCIRCEVTSKVTKNKRKAEPRNLSATLQNPLSMT